MLPSTRPTITVPERRGSPEYPGQTHRKGSALITGNLLGNEAGDRGLKTPIRCKRPRRPDAEIELPRPRRCRHRAATSNARRPRRNGTPTFVLYLSHLVEVEFADFARNC